MSILKRLFGGSPIPPSWRPLEERLGKETCSEFTITRRGDLNIYTHTPSGIGLGLDDEGRCFVFKNGKYEPCDFDAQWERIRSKVVAMTKAATDKQRRPEGQKVRQDEHKGRPETPPSPHGEEEKRSQNEIKARELIARIQTGTPSNQNDALVLELGKTRWAGAIECLKQELSKTSDPELLAFLGSALARCGEPTDGLGVLYEGLSKCRLGLAFRFTGMLSDLDEEGIRDPRLIQEMLSFAFKLSYGNIEALNQVGAGQPVQRAIEYVDEIRERHEEEWRAAWESRYRVPAKGKPAKNESIPPGKAMYTIGDAADLTGVPVEEIKRLVREGQVFSVADGGKVQIDGGYPCGEIYRSAQHRFRAIGGMR